MIGDQMHLCYPHLKDLPLTGATESASGLTCRVSHSFHSYPIARSLATIASTSKNAFMYISRLTQTS